jgi:hypothetical protein
MTAHLPAFQKKGEWPSNNIDWTSHTLHLVWGYIGYDVKNNCIICNITVVSIFYFYFFSSSQGMILFIVSSHGIK